MKCLKIVGLILGMLVVLICVFSGTTFGAIISNRTHDGQWVTMLDDTTGTLTIRLKDNFTEGGLGTVRINEDDWKNVWKMSASNSTDIRQMVKHIVFKENNVGAKFDFNEKPAAYMFKGFTNLEDIDFNGVKQDSKVAETIRGMFQECKKLKEVDLGWMATKENSLQNIQDLFNGCTSLEKVIINNPNFITRTSTKDANENVTNGAAQMGRMFSGCSSLKSIDMSNITLYGRDDNWTQINDKAFTSELESIETITMNNIKLPNFKNLNNVFANLTTLREFSMRSDNPGDIAPDVIEIESMFKNSFTSPAGEGVVVLDISGLGKLENIVNMDGLIEGCSNLETLNIDNLDNSNIGPTNNRHSVNEEDYTIQDIGAIEFGREIFGKGKYDIASSFPNLTTISARNSNVWMCKNNRGLPGNEYYIASNEKDVLYFTNKNTTFTPDGKSKVEIDSKRDYIDLITDRDGIINHTFSPSIGTLPDAGKNINIVNGDLNPLGAGKLAPGIYEIGSAKWEDRRIEPLGSYYRISYLGKVPYKVEGPKDSGDIVILEGTNNTYINTEYKSVAEWGNYEYVIDCSGDKAIKIIYEDAAIDVMGQRHDLIITINKITFKNLNKIPKESGRDHDGNSYVYGGYYRTILRASEEDGLMFRNYVVNGNPESLEDVDNRYKVLSGGAGTDIDFTISIEGAEEGKTFVFYVDDLDVAAAQNWERPFNDVCYDNLPVENSTYGLGGEGFILGEGNYKKTVKFAEHTGLRLIQDNQDVKPENADDSKDAFIITTGSDPSTSWSEFEVKAKATGAKYTWTSGIACDSYALRNTLPPNNKLRITKVWEDRGEDLSPRPDDLQISLTNYDDEIPEWTKVDDFTWSVIIDDVANTHRPEKGYFVTEAVLDKYNEITESNELVYNEETGYFEATLKNKEKTVNITVEKEWKDTEEQKDKRPEKIKLQVLDGETVVKEYELDTKTETTHEFIDLPKYNKNGEEIKYSIEEREVNEGDLKFYSKEIVGNKITNTFTKPEDKIELTVYKKWIDTEKQSQRRPANIKIMIMNNGEIVQEYYLKTGEESSHTFTDLAKYDDNGNEIVYTADEQEVNNGDLRFYEKSIDGMEITNTYRNKLSIVIVKYVEKGTNKELAEEFVVSGNVDDEYKLTPKDISGYTMVEVEGNEEGTIGEEPIEVVYYYEKDKAEEETKPEVKQEVKSEEKKTDNPKTGDNIIKWVVTMFVSLITLYFVSSKNKSNGKHNK